MEPEESEKETTGPGQENAAGTGTGGHGKTGEREEDPDRQDPVTLPGGLTGAAQDGPGPDAMPQETGKNLMKNTKPVNTRPAVEVDRKTELQGMYTKASPGDPAQVRKRTERDLRSPGFDIPYAKTERAVRDLVCSLLERQDRMNADLFLEINAMQEDIGMLKDQVYKLRIMKTSPSPAGAKK